MGRRGPPKKPTELKLLQGTPGGKHNLNDAEPRPPKVKAAKPSFKLTPAQKRIFRELASKLEASGVLTELDIDGLTRLCVMKTQWRELKDFVEKNGWYYALYHEQTEEEKKSKAEPRVKYMALYPQAALLNQIGRDILRLEQQFGCLPAARPEIKISRTGEKKSEVKSKLYGSK